MRKIVLAPDSFKGAMSSLTVCSLMAGVIREIWPQCTVESIPMADGGEGTLEALASACRCRSVQLRARGPWAEDVDASFLLLDDGTAVVESAQCCGLSKTGGRLDPSRTTTYGVGQLALAASREADRICITLGGSATNDAGCGFLAACGVRFLDSSGRSFIPTGESLDRVANIDMSGLDGKLAGLPVDVLCDVRSPFCGPQGAAQVYARQKGADDDMVRSLDEKMESFATLVEEKLAIRLRDLPSGGAAGGLGGALYLLPRAVFRSGIETVLKLTDFDRRAEGADLVITGEGRLDSQSFCGKAVGGVAARASALGIPSIALAGSIEGKPEDYYALGLCAVFSTNIHALPAPEAMAGCRDDLCSCLTAVLRTVAALGPQD